MRKERAIEEGSAGGRRPGGGEGGLVSRRPKRTVRGEGGGKGSTKTLSGRGEGVNGRRATGSDRCRHWRDLCELFCGAEH